MSAFFPGWNATLEDVRKINWAEYAENLRKLRTKDIIARLGISSTEFETFLISYGIDTDYERETKKPCYTRFGYIVEKGSPAYGSDGWSTPGDGKWAVSNAMIARHIGYHEIYGSFFFEFVGLRAPKYRKITWVDFDIDHANHNFEDSRLLKILTTFGEERCLVQYRPESGNFSILMRCIPLYPEKHQEVFRSILERIGLLVKDGNIEIYPQVDRARRFPFGDQCVYEGYDFLHRQGEDPLRWASSKLQSFEELYRHWCVNPYQVLRDIERFHPIASAPHDEVMRPAKPKKKTSIKQRKKSSTKESVHQSTQPKKTETNQEASQRFKLKEGLNPLAEKPDSEPQTNYQKEMRAIWKSGLEERCTRYETEKRLIRWCYSQGLSEEEAYAEIDDWYRSGKTNGLSFDWIRCTRQVLRSLKRHIRTFYKWLKKHWNEGKSGMRIEPAPLTTFDVINIIKACDWDLHLAEWLYDCLKWTKARIKHIDHLYLSARIMRQFRRGRDSDKRYVPRLVKMGILTCIERDFRVGSDCRIWQVNWRFSQSGKVVPVDLSFRQALCLVTSPDEIKAHCAWTTAWRINRLRKGLETLELSLAGPMVETRTPKPETQTGGQVSFGDPPFNDSIKRQWLPCALTALVTSSAQA